MPRTRDGQPEQQPAAVQLYLAAPLFTLQERVLNRQLAEAVERAYPGCRVVLPQDFKHDDRYNDQRAFGFIFDACIEQVSASQCVIACLDGADADSGTSFEAGYAFAKGIPVIGVRTDFRPSQERGVNLMLSRACAAFVHRPAFDEDVSALAKEIVRALNKVLKQKPVSRSRA